MSLPTAIRLEQVSVVYRSRRTFFRSSAQTALADVGFEVMQGETFGVVGGNAGGKSTLLKILAGIIAPDTGRIVINCRSSMLLTLGVGFLPELTGRENALLSGVLQGSTISRMKAMLTDIADFSGLGSAIDRPLKSYSSGMRARLGFTVALYGESELVLIDEILGVGDRVFRKRAEDALRKKLSSGVTVVLVSHASQQIKRLCSRALWLEKGRVMSVGSAASVVDDYVESSDRARQAGGTDA